MRSHIDIHVLIIQLSILCALSCILHHTPLAAPVAKVPRTRVLGRYLRHPRLPRGLYSTCTMTIDFLSFLFLPSVLCQGAVAPNASSQSMRYRVSYAFRIGLPSSLLFHHVRVLHVRTPSSVRTAMMHDMLPRESHVLSLLVLPLGLPRLSFIPAS